MLALPKGSVGYATVTINTDMVNSVKTAAGGAVKTGDSVPSGTVITIDYGFQNTAALTFVLYINNEKVDESDLIGIGEQTKTYDYTVTSDIDIQVRF